MIIAIAICMPCLRVLSSVKAIDIGWIFCYSDVGESGGLFKG
jgi:hypothetical protein